MDFGETVVIQLSNSATSTATKLNSDIVSCRPHSMAHYPHDSTAGFRNPPHPLINSTFHAINQNTTRLFAVMKTQLMLKCLQYWGQKKNSYTLYKHYSLGPLGF